MANKGFWNAGEGTFVTTSAAGTKRRLCKVFHEKTPSGLEQAINAWIESEPADVLGTHVVPYRDNTVMCLLFYDAVVKP